MSDKELADMLCSGKAVSITMSKDGYFIRSGEVQREITSDQVEVTLLAIQDLYT